MELMMKINLIAAIASNNCIGLNGKMPWHIPDDLKHFKSLTMGKPVIMGRRTWESLSDTCKPLAGRENIVMTSSSIQLPDNVIKCKLFKDVIIHLLRNYGFEENECFIIGGSQVYKEALDKNLVDRMYITRINKEFDGDTFFPEFNKDEWELSSVIPMQHEDLSYQFETWECKR